MYSKINLLKITISQGFLCGDGIIHKCYVDDVYNMYVYSEITYLIMTIRVDLEISTFELISSRYNAKLLYIYKSLKHVFDEL